MGAELPNLSFRAGRCDILEVEDVVVIGSTIFIELV